MLKIRDCMKKNVFAIHDTDTVSDAINQLVTRHIGLLPVLNRNEQPIGVVGLRDLLNLALPAVVHMLDDVDFLGDFGAVEAYVPSDEILNQPITRLMRPSTVVREDAGLLRAYTTMLRHDLHDLPVIDHEGRLCGIASRVDIGTTILSSWQKG